MMEDIYKYFNDIEVDIEKINSIDAELDDVSKRRVKNNVRSLIKTRKHKLLIKSGIVAAAIILFLSFSAIIPQHSFSAFAESIPILNTLFQKFGLGYGGDFKDYTQVIEETKKSKGYEVKLNEIVMDDFSFKLIYTIKCPEKVSGLIKRDGNPFPYTPAKSVKINGMNFVGGAGGSDRVIDEYTIQVIEDYDINEMNIPKNFDVEIDFKEVNNVKGDWKFNFNVSKEKIAKNIKNYNLNKQLQIQNEGKEVVLIFKKISFSPISTAVLIKSNNEFEYGNLIFKDEEGNIIKPYSSSVNAYNGILGYNGTVLYKFEPIQKVPNKLAVEYKNTDTVKSDIIELILK